MPRVESSTQTLVWIPRTSHPRASVRPATCPDFGRSRTSYTYTVNGRNGDTTTNTVHIDVLPVDDQPAAAPDSLTTAEDTAGTVAVLANDAGLAEGPLSVVVSSPPANGLTQVNGDLSVTYSPSPNFFGSDSFVYTVTDVDGDTSSATVSLAVSAVNDAPIAIPRYSAATVGNPTQIELSSLDVDDGCAVVFEIATPPARGTLTGLAPFGCGDAVVTYTAAETGFDAFTFRVRDPSGAEGVALVTLVVTASGAALLGVETEASTVSGPLVSESLDDGSCTTTPCALTSLSTSTSPESFASGFSRASRGLLSAQSSGGRTADGPDASFSGKGFGFFTLPDLVFLSPDATVCPAGMNLVLNGLLEAVTVGGTVTASLGIHVDVGGNVFDGTLLYDGSSFIGTGLLAGMTSTENVLLTTPGFCVPTNVALPLTVALETRADGELVGSASGFASSNYANTLSFPDSGPVFELPSGATADAPSGGVANNHWVEPVLPIAIDVKPRDPDNMVRCKPSRRIAVAVLTTPAFDAMTLDANTVELAGAHEAHRKHDYAKRHEKDVDHDGDLDLLFHFRLGDTSLTCDEDVVSLTGEVLGGIPLVVGSDRIQFRGHNDQDSDGDEDDSGDDEDCACDHDGACPGDDGEEHDDDHDDEEHDDDHDDGNDDHGYDDREGGNR